MAENEILDLGNPRRYRAFRKALKNPDFSPEQIAGCLPDEFVSNIRKNLQGMPLYSILKACGKDRAALNAVIANCKNGDLARWAEKAYKLTGSMNPAIVAGSLADLLIDKLKSQTKVHALKHAHTRESNWHRALHAATDAKLDSCKSEIVKLVTASLENSKLPRQPRQASRKQSARSLANSSLLNSSALRPSGEMRHA